MGFWDRTMPTPGRCGCARCNPRAGWMIVCETCGNKRCPHATDHDYECTRSNEPGPPGSSFGPPIGEPPEPNDD